MSESKLRTKFIDKEGFEKLTIEALVRRLRSKGHAISAGHARLFVEALYADDSEDDGVARYLLAELATDLRMVSGPQDVGDLLALAYNNRADGHSVIAWDPREEADGGGWYIGSLKDMILARADEAPRRP